MKTGLATLFLALAFCSSLLADSRHPLIDVQRERYDAMISQDMGGLARLLGDDLVYSHSDGTIETKDEFLKTVKSGVIRYFHLDDLKLRIRDRGNWAILNGVVAMDCVLGSRPRGIVHLNFTAVYEKRDNRWQMTTWQTTMARKQPKM